MVSYGSPTLALIQANRRGRMESNMSSGDNARPATEVERLRVDNQVLRRKLAQMTAMYIWAEGGSYSKIDQEIRQYGFKLESMSNGMDPRITPINKDVG